MRKQGKRKRLSACAERKAILGFFINHRLILSLHLLQENPTSRH